MLFHSEFKSTIDLTDKPPPTEKKIVNVPPASHNNGIFSKENLTLLIGEKVMQKLNILKVLAIY